ncbi:hypothetical protein [Candidatus Paracaedibacter symbiosus]|uniref:phosphatase domain-containing putative toxin n=1 Tax=Candidatus Paracaedibacter symbiosus TaxID=244582 RepID=UPI0005093BDA|nr:hypothetical protein [Candidatus Paracaedibacter symbiosus]
MIKYVLFLASVFITHSQAQVAYDPCYVLGWNAIPHRNNYMLAPYDIILDAANSQTLPAHFRSPRFLTLTPARHNEVNFKGFYDLRMSGSGQFSENQLEELVKYLTKMHHIKPEKIIIVDLREEPHGFINGDAITFYYGPLTLHRNKSTATILDSDNQRINWLRSLSHVVIYKVTKGDDGMPSNKTPKLLTVKSALTEWELSTRLGIQYVRIPVTDHFMPDNNDVDQFLEFVEGLDSGTWLHFKCRGGKGRTTTFMAMYDMVKNPNLPKREFIKRQTLIYGVDLAKSVNKVGKQSWKWSLSVERIQFIDRFYTYLHSKDGYGIRKWSEWVRIHYPGVLDEMYTTFVE